MTRHLHQRIDQLEGRVRVLEDNVDVPEPVTDKYDDRTSDVLRAELTRRGLDTDGKKAELVSRLEDNDAEVTA